MADPTGQFAGGTSGGILIFLIFLPLYAAGLFLMCKIIGWDMRWTQCSGLIAIVQVMRVVDRMLFRSGR
jgi:hypothetical protein